MEYEHAFAGDYYPFPWYEYPLLHKFHGSKHDNHHKIIRELVLLTTLRIALFVCSIGLLVYHSAMPSFPYLLSSEHYCFSQMRLPLSGTNDAHHRLGSPSLAQMQGFLSFLFIFFSSFLFFSFFSFFIMSHCLGNSSRSLFSIQ